MNLSLDGDEVKTWKDNNRGESLSAFLRSKIYQANRQHETLDSRLIKLARVYDSMENDPLQRDLNLEPQVKGINEAYGLDLNVKSLKAMIESYVPRVRLLKSV